MKQKFTISLNQKTFEILTKFVEVTGNTKSAFISQVLDDQCDSLEKLIHMVEDAKKSAEIKMIKDEKRCL